MIYSFVLDVLTLVKVEGFHKHTNDIRHLSAPLHVCTISIPGCSTSNPFIKSDKKKKKREGRKALSEEASCEAMYILGTKY
jgi:hypothetical protein